MLTWGVELFVVMDHLGGQDLDETGDGAGVNGLHVVQQAKRDHRQLRVPHRVHRRLPLPVRQNLQLKIFTSQ